MRISFSRQAAAHSSPLVQLKGLVRVAKDQIISMQLSPRALMQASTQRPQPPQLSVSITGSHLRRVGTSSFEEDALPPRAADARAGELFSWLSRESKTA